ncbi:PIN domain-containing protein [Pyrococcus kukulkanii]|uniref:PIN domain-containing protein n=1 Tax=Pyrococcus kukulkanii TaxID=1609559 RepID=UPI003564C4C0
MNVVVDSNILFSIIVSGRKSKAFRLLEEHEITLFAPEEIIFEFRRHTCKLKKFAKDFEYRTFLAFSLVQILPLEFYSDKIKEAYEVASKFDEKDTASLSSKKFVALDTLALESLLAGKSLEEVLKDMESRLRS